MIELSVVQDVSSDVSAVNPTIIKIIGCGGGGSSAVNRMIEAGVKDVEFIVLNTDLQALNISKAQKRLAIGQKLTGGLGAGGNPEVGENAAKEDPDQIKNIVQGADMVIITAGMGGGTGTGSAPVVASIAREAGALTIAVVTTPFEFEGPVRMSNAQDGLKKLRENVDSLIVIPNQQIMKVADKKVTFKQAFKLADDVLCQGVQGISDVITIPGEINLDFADVKSVMKGQGNAILGVGFGSGENRAVDAAQNAISNPMLEDRQIDGASKILINIIGDESISMEEVQEIVSNIKSSASSKVEVFMGIGTLPDMGDRISVTVIATGFETLGDSQDDYYAEEASKPVNDNVMDYGTFEGILQGKTTAPVEKKVEVQQKMSTITLQPSSLDNSNGAVEQNRYVATNSLNDTLARSSTVRTRPNPPPEGFIRNKGDFSQPAVWRNADTLPRNIPLTDDK